MPFQYPTLPQNVVITHFRSAIASTAITEKETNNILINFSGFHYSYRASKNRQKYVLEYRNITKIIKIELTDFVFADQFRPLLTINYCSAARPSKLIFNFAVQFSPKSSEFLGNG